jgi:hypothetical protein
VEIAESEGRTTLKISTKFEYLLGLFWGGCKVQEST